MSRCAGVSGTEVRVATSREAVSRSAGLSLWSVSGTVRGSGSSTPAQAWLRVCTESDTAVGPERSPGQGGGGAE